MMFLHRGPSGRFHVGGQEGRLAFQLKASFRRGLMSANHSAEGVPVLFKVTATYLFEFIFTSRQASLIRENKPQTMVLQTRVPSLLLATLECGATTAAKVSGLGHFKIAAFQSAGGGLVFGAVCQAKLAKKARPAGSLSFSMHISHVHVKRLAECDAETVERVILLN